MRTIDYDYSRVQELDLSKIELVQIARYYEDVTQNNIGLKMYCEDPDSFWKSKYAPQ